MQNNTTPEETLLKSIDQYRVKLNSVDKHIVLNDLYDITYGIYNHLDPRQAKPLSSVIYKDVEDFTTYSLTEEIIRSYVAKDIGKTFKLSLIEFLELPRDIVTMLLEIAHEQLERKAKDMEEIENQLTGEDDDE